jgi:hypothetical protein
MRQRVYQQVLKPCPAHLFEKGYELQAVITFLAGRPICVLWRPRRI